MKKAGRATKDRGRLQDADTISAVEEHYLIVLGKTMVKKQDKGRGYSCLQQIGRQLVFMRDSWLQRRNLHPTMVG